MHGPTDCTERGRYFQLRDNVEHAAYAVKMAAVNGETLPDGLRKWATLAPALNEAEKRRNVGEDVFLKFNTKVVQTIGQIAG